MTKEDTVIKEDGNEFKPSNNKDRLQRQQRYEQELLNDPQLNLTYESLSEQSEYINWDDVSITEKATRFKESFLFQIRAEMEEKESEITHEDLTHLVSLNKKFNKYVDFSELSSEVIDTIIKFQKKKLESNGLDKSKITAETLHIKGVTNIAKTTFPTNKLLAMIASVHDAFKYTANNKYELGLHELATTFYGPQLLIKTLKLIAKNKGIELDEDELKAFKKLARRAIFTHGFQEFLQLMSSQKPIDRENKLFNLTFGKEAIYPSTAKESIPNDDVLGNDTEDNIATETIAAMNACDMAIGSTLGAFMKYNLSYSNQVLAEYQNLHSFIDDKLFASFESNLNGKAARFLTQKNDEHLLNNFIEKTRIIGNIFNNLFKDDISADWEHKSKDRQKEIIKQIREKFNVKPKDETEFKEHIYQIIKFASLALKFFLILKKAIEEEKHQKKDVGEINDLRANLNSALISIIFMLSKLNEKYDVKLDSL